MNDNNDKELFYTASMARVYASQGHFDKAADIYRYLIQRHPDKEEFSIALTSIKEQSKTNAGPLPKQETPEINQPRGNDLESLLDQWISLLIQHNAINKLKKL